MTIEEAWIKFVLLTGTATQKSRDLYDFLDANVLNILNVSVKDISAFISEERLAYYRAHPLDQVLNRTLELLGKHDIRFLHIDHTDYPSVLKQIYDPPWVIFYKGKGLNQNFWGLGVVGTRKCDVYGRKLAFEWGAILARHNIPVNSGLARGVDSFAHSGCLEAGGRTVAVLGHGLDQIYPRENQKLAESILDKNGLLVTEYLPRIEPLPHHFPARNRIINGLSKGIIVIQADVKSGSLITADFAIETHRPVFAVPGRPCDTAFKGCNQLIKDGANMLLDMSDIADGLGLTLISHAETAVAEIEFKCDAEKKIYTALSYDAISQEELFFKMNMERDTFVQSMFALELRGAIVRHPGQLWTRK